MIIKTYTLDKIGPETIDQIVNIYIKASDISTASSNRIDYNDAVHKCTIVTLNNGRKLTLFASVSELLGVWINCLNDPEAEIVELSNTAYQ